MSIFSGLASEFIKAAKALKSDILKVVEKTPAVLATIDKDAPEVEALIALAFPGASALEAAGMAVLDAVGAAIQSAGPAATANGLSVSADKGVIAAVEAVGALFKKL